jgi:uncharacterized protein YodC (DUF2158 family)
MEPEFKSGDMVRCKIGGPVMVVSARTTMNIGNGHQAYSYTCFRWDHNANEFRVNTIGEGALELTENE